MGVCGWVCYHDNSILRASILTKPRFVGKGGDHLQLVKFWPSHAPGKGVCSRAKNFGSALLQPVCSVCVSLSTFSLFYFISMKFVQKYTWKKTSCAGAHHNMPHPLQVDLWPFDLESGAQVACYVAYLYANFSLPRPQCSRLRPDVCDRHQTDVRQMSDVHHCLMQEKQKRTYIGAYINGLTD